MLKQKFLNVVGVSIIIGMVGVHAQTTTTPSKNTPSPHSTTKADGEKGATKNVGLKAFLQKAYDYSPELQTARYERSAKESELMTAMSRFAPDVSLSANATKSFFNSSLGGAIETLHDTDYNVQGKVSVNLNLFRGGADVFGLASANARQEGYDVEYKAKLQKFLLDAAEVYINAKNAQEALEIYKTFELRGRYNFERVQTEYRLGASNNTDVHMAKAELARAVSGRIKAQTTLTNAREAYKEMCGMLPSNLTYPSMELSLPKSLDDSLKMAEGKSLTARGGVAKLRAARNGLAATMVGLASPSVDAFVEFNKPLASDKYEESNGNGSVGIRISYELFSNSGRGANFASVKQAVNQHQAAVYGNDYARNKMRKEVIAAWHGVSMAKAQEMQAQVAVEASRNAYDGGREQFRLGQMKYADFIKVEEQLLKNELAYLDSRKEAYLAGLRLLNATGLLTPSKLGLVINSRDDEGR